MEINATKQNARRFVDIESPYAGASLGKGSAGVREVLRNIRYTRACMRDSLLRGEIPFASHLVYTQSGILDDNVPQERHLGIMAGKELIEKLNASTVVYTDLGISKGMELGIKMAQESGRSIEYRSLGEGWKNALNSLEDLHSHNRIWIARFINGVDTVITEDKEPLDEPSANVSVKLG
jgi:hypothetical protein